MRPGGLVVAAVGRLGQDLQLRHGNGALADGRAHAVAARVAAADHDHVLALGGEHGPLAGGLVVAGHAAVLLAEEVHGEVYAAEVGPGHVQRPRLAGAHAEANRVELAAQLGGGDVAADVHARLEPHALPRHLLQAAVDDPLLELEIGNAIAQQAADAVVLLEEHRLVAGPIDLLGGGQAGGAGADDRHPLARPRGGQDGLDPAFLRRPVRRSGYSMCLMVTGAIVDGQRAGRLAGGRADPAGHFREVVRRVQVLGRRPPVAAIDQVVELRDAVLHRAAGGVAKRNAAIHAAGRLLVEHVVDQRPIDFVPVLDPFGNRTVGNFRTGELLEACGIAHDG